MVIHFLYMRAHFERSELTWNVARFLQHTSNSSETSLITATVPRISEMTSYCWRELTGMKTDFTYFILSYVACFKRRSLNSAVYKKNVLALYVLRPDILDS
jgi:hypothetical protein